MPFSLGITVSILSSLDGLSKSSSDGVGICFGGVSDVSIGFSLRFPKIKGLSKFDLARNKNVRKS